MPGTDWNRRPGNFSQCPIEEPIGKLVAIIRAERRHVIITYADGRWGLFAHEYGNCLGDHAFYLVRLPISERRVPPLDLVGLIEGPAALAYGRALDLIFGTGTDSV